MSKIKKYRVTYSYQVTGDVEVEATSKKSAKVWYKLQGKYGNTKKRSSCDKIIKVEEV